MGNKGSEIGIYDGCFNGTVFDAVSKNTTCLDVGCWTGNLGKSLINKKRCVVDGVDYKREALDEAKRQGYRETYLVNFNDEDFDLGLGNNKYDFIICADVLEHLRDPGVVLERLRRFLKDEGRLVISVPNIGFIQQRVLLMAGNFSYNPNGGIMDETHLRFFTFSTIKNLCLKSGYKIIRSSGYAQVKDRFFFLRYLAGICPSLFAIQFLLVLKKDEK
jgi:2-polyprenyl-3-methyl-5-hydroxy-6-metoxy-1,4-benzoquinol methylase